MPRRRRHRIYWREDRNGYYGDFRDYRDVGGGRESLRPHPHAPATRDLDEANRLAAVRLEVLDKRRRHDANNETLLVDYARRHLAIKREHRRLSTVRRDEECLQNVIAFFGEHVTLSEISVRRLNDYVQHRRRQPGSRAGETVQAQTVLHELHALSNLFRRAVSEDLATMNPVALMTDKPTVRRREAVWLELGEAARLIQAGFAIDAAGGRSVPFLGPLLATFLLTGGRKGEVFGLEVRDVDRRHDVVHIRPNVWRPLKRDHHARTVPLWPQLRTILARHVGDRDAEALVFPATRGGVLRDIRESIAKAVARAGITRRVVPHTFRHTYAAARLQTMDHGQPVSPYTVMRELGHQSIQLIETTYGHLQHRRHRATAVEYTEAKVLPMEDVS